MNESMGQNRSRSNCSQLVYLSQNWLYVLGLVTALSLFPHLLNRDNPISGRVVVKMRGKRTEEIVICC